MNSLSHVDDTGKATMVDVGDKPIQKRTAKARGTILLKPETLDLIRQNAVKKGDVPAVARIAGIQAAKQTPNLIPLCHTLILDHVDVSIELSDDRAVVTATVNCTGRTGAEMEALTAVTVALLTIYDMCKAVDNTMQIDNVRLLEKVKSDEC